MDLKLKNKTVLITGASGGIGYQASKTFDEEGSKLVLHYNTNEKNIKKLKSELKNNNIICQADLRNENEVVKMFEEANEELGRIDILICNAGVWPEEDTMISEMSLDRWNDTITNNLTSVFLCCREFLKNLKRYPDEHGVIVLVGSTAAVFGEAFHSDYSTSKSGFVYGLNRSLKNEIVNIAKYGRVNVVCPGWTITPMARAHLQNPEAIKKSQKTMALEKMATTEDIASTIIYLASDKLSGHISGEVITVAGGMEGRILH